MRGVMDALSPGSPVRRAVFMKAAQVGATEVGNNSSWRADKNHHCWASVLAY